MSKSKCKYVIESAGVDIHMVLDCKVCWSECDKKTESCLNRIIRTVEDENDIKIIIMKDHQITKFEGEVVSLILRISELRVIIRKMSGRKSAVESIDKTNRAFIKFVNKRCTACRYYPSRFFQDICNSPPSDFKALTVAIGAAINKVTFDLSNTEIKVGQNICLQCIAELFKDITYLVVRYKAVAREISELGFSLVVE